MALLRPYFIFILIVPFFVQYSSCVNLTTLRLVQVVYRHGDRAPIFTYPTDPYKDEEKYWPNGFGELTNKGMDQQYDLGSYFRDRYDGFIGRRYSRKEIHVLSSDVDRTLMSAEANLAGLFPKLDAFTHDNHGQAASEGKVDMQLVPIHTLMKGSDKLIKMDARCLRREAALEEYGNSPTIQKFKDENDELFQYVKENTGRSIDFFGAMKMSDILYSQQQHNLTLPSWATPEVFEKMRYLNGVSFSMKGGTDELRKLYGGPLLKRVVDNMETAISKTTQTKFYMHAAHDDTLAALMTSIGVFEVHNPDYASAFIIELHEEESTGKYIVDVLYRNSTEHEPYPMHIPECGTPCYLDEMETLLAPYIPADWEQDCNSNFKLLNGNETIVVYQFNITSFMYFLAVVITSVVVLIGILWVATRRRGARDFNSGGNPGWDKESYAKILP